MNSITATLKRFRTPPPSSSDATFTPLTILAPNTTYKATITTEIKDTVGIAMTDEYNWSFTTGSEIDTTAPTVSSTNPAHKTTEVSLNSVICVVFSEAMDAASLQSGVSIAMRTSSVFTDRVFTGRVSSDGATASFTPSPSLTINSTYMVYIYGGSMSVFVTDLAGNAMLYDYSWVFTTGEVPMVTPACQGPAIISP